MGGRWAAERERPVGSSPVGGWLHHGGVGGRQRVGGGSRPGAGCGGGDPHRALVSLAGRAPPSRASSPGVLLVGTHVGGESCSPILFPFFSFFLSLPVPLGRTGGVPVARGRGAAAPRRRQTAARQRSTPPLFSIPLTDGSVPRPWPFPPPPHGWVRAPSVCPSLPHRSPAAAADAGGPRRQRGSPYPGIGWGVAEIHRGGHVGGTVQAQNLPRPAPASRTGGNGHARGVERGGGGREGGRAGGGRGEGREGLPFAAR